MLVSNLDYSEYLGRNCVGRIVSGSGRGPAIRSSAFIAMVAGTCCCHAAFYICGIGAVEIARDRRRHHWAHWFEEVYIGETLLIAKTDAAQFVDIDPPTIPHAHSGQRFGCRSRRKKFVTARIFASDLFAKRAVMSHFRSRHETAGAFEINARGEMQIAILVEPDATRRLRSDGLSS